MLRKFIPKSIFGRIFWGNFFVSAFFLVVIWLWLYNGLYASLDAEASLRMKKMASNLVGELKLLGNVSTPSFVYEKGALQNFWEHEKAGGWIQNLYWVDLTSSQSAFIASYSTRNVSNNSVIPPTFEEAEDMIFDFINELETGRAVTPDAFAYGISRQYKIVLFPILDQFQMLESVIGIEADMKYLALAVQLRDLFYEVLLALLILSFVISAAIAKSFSKKLEFLTAELKIIESGNIPKSIDLHVQELNLLHDGLIELAREIKDKNKQVRDVFARKLEELSFTGGAIAHEIRNPLSAIEMHYGLLRRELVKNNIDNYPSVNEIKEQLEHLKALVSSFLSYSRKIVPVKEKIELNSFVSELVKSRSEVVGSFNYKINIPENYYLYFDRTMLTQIIDNLLNNALEAALNNDLQIIISASYEAKNSNLVIENNGPPIPAEIFEKLFTPFITSKAGGNGIGLALVRKMVEAHSGEIFCENLEHGVKFVIEVPCNENSDS